MSPRSRAEYYRILAEVEGQPVEGFPRSVSETSAVLEALLPQTVLMEESLGDRHLFRYRHLRGGL